MMRLMGTAVVTAALGLAFALSPAQATTVDVGFALITNNGNTNVASQLNVQVSDVGVPAGSVGFLFTNAVGIASSITDIYFEVASGILNGTPLGIVESGAGVNFSTPATPGDLPGGNLASPPFPAAGTLQVSADSDAPISANGIDAASESVRIILTLASGMDIFDLSGNIRIGLHVQSIAPQGGSDSYISNPVVINPLTSPVPLPAGIWLFGSALVGLGALKLKRRRKALSAA